MPILWPPDAKNWLIWKDPDAGKDWGQEKGMTEDEMVGWCHWLNDVSLGELWEWVTDREYVQFISSVQSLSRVRLCDPMNRSVPGLPGVSKPLCHNYWACA